MKIYLQLFFTFFKIGMFTIGGGYAMIPLLEREVVDKKKWLSSKDFLDIIAIAQAVPGIIFINVAIYVGYKIRGTKGCIVSILGSVLPSFAVILSIAMVFRDFKDNETVNKIFKGIRPVVVALIITPLWKMVKSAKITWKTAIIPVFIAVMIWQTNISPIIFIVLAIAAGIIYQYKKTG